MWLALAGAIATEVLGTLALRASDVFRRRRCIIPMSLAYLASFYLLWLTLSLGMPVGIAYGVWTACGVALMAVAARFLFAEPLTWLMGLGLTSSPRLKPGDSNPFMLRAQHFGFGAVIPRGFLLVPASMTAPGPRAGVGLHRR